MPEDQPLWTGWCRYMGHMDMLIAIYIYIYIYADLCNLNAINWEIASGYSELGASEGTLVLVLLSIVRSTIPPRYISSTNVYILDPSFKFFLSILYGHSWEFLFHKVSIKNIKQPSHGDDSYSPYQCRHWVLTHSSSQTLKAAIARSPVSYPGTGNYHHYYHVEIK